MNKSTLLATGLGALIGLGFFFLNPMIGALIIAAVIIFAVLIVKKGE